MGHCNIVHVDTTSVLEKLRKFEVETKFCLKCILSNAIMAAQVEGRLRLGIKICQPNGASMADKDASRLGVSRCESLGANEPYIRMFG